MRRLKKEEFFAEMMTKFGAEQLAWRFRCPECGTAQSLQDYVDAGITREDAADGLGSQCIGNRVKHLGCTYKLLDDPRTDKPGCIEVLKPDGSAFVCFELATTLQQPAESTPVPDTDTDPVAVVANVEECVPETENKDKPDEKKKEEDDEMVMTEEQKKEANRIRVAKYRAEAKKGGAKTKADPDTADKSEDKDKDKDKDKAGTITEVPVRKPVTVRPPLPKLPKQTVVKGARKDRTGTVLIIRIGDNDQPSVVVPAAGTKPHRTIAEAQAYVRQNCPSGCYDFALVKATKTLNVETKEIRELK